MHIRLNWRIMNLQERYKSPIFLVELDMIKIEQIDTLEHVAVLSMWYIDSQFTSTLINH